MKMRKLFAITLILITVLLSACTCHRFDSQDNAALKLYCKYADNDNLTVAYLCDFTVEAHAINAVMLQANDDSTWDWLQTEFSVPEQADTAYTVEMGMEWNTEVTIDENIFQKEHLDDEEVALFAQAIVGQLSEAINSLLASEQEVQKATIAINDKVNLLSDIDLGVEFRDSTAVQRILEAVANMLNDSGLEYKDTIVETDATIISETRDDTNEGYIIAVDYKNRTLWMFFYDDAEECSSIMTHIRKDIFTYQ